MGEGQGRLRLGAASLAASVSITDVEWLPSGAANGGFRHFADVQTRAAMVWGSRCPATTNLQGEESTPNQIDFAILSSQRVSTFFPNHPHPPAPYSTYRANWGGLNS